MFGRRKASGQQENPSDESSSGPQGDSPSVPGHFPIDLANGDGPYDLADSTADRDAVAVDRLDLGSVLVPLPAGGQLQVEMAPNGEPQAVHMVTQHGRITVAAYAAPKSPGQWREVVGDLSESLRSDNATVSMETGPWGRELVGVTPTADLRFVGVDGYRWMIRCVLAGPSGSVAEGSPLLETARNILKNTVVDRGLDPQPVRTPLTVTLPAELAQQLAAAQQQQVVDQQQNSAGSQNSADPQNSGAQTAQPTPDSDTAVDSTTPDLAARRGSSGSAMQQLGN